MKVGHSILARFIDVPRDASALRALLDDVGIEVKRTETVGQDTVFTVELLANRGDHYCYAGIAREISGRTGAPLCTPDIARLTAGASPVPMHIETERCSLYSLTLLECREPASLPPSVTPLIEAAGLGSVSPPVDATNVANLELGQPTHAFDADTIVGPVRVRDSVAGETAWLLFTDGPVEVPEGTMVIADDEKILAIAGVIGCEMAQAFAAFGTEVHLVDMSERVLSREDADASELVQQALVEDGVILHLGAAIERVERDGETRTVVLGDGTRIDAPAVLVALGRRPNVDLDLDQAGVQTGKSGIEVNDFLQTTNPHIYAAGDVNGLAQFTHAADHQARAVVRNALFFGRERHSALVVPRVTYTDPELAAVGISTEAAQDDDSLTTWTVALDETDRGRTDGSTGFVRVHADSKGVIHGANVVGGDAGELLAPITLAMTHGVTLGQIASTIHPYPTLSEALFKVASEYNRTRLRPWIKRVFTWMLAWRR